ncbi:hypothetical protein Hanom_Chr10g00926501 [Helianthus anomalus]
MLFAWSHTIPMKLQIGGLDWEDERKIMMMTIRDRRRMWVPEIDAGHIPVAGKRCDESIKVGVFSFGSKFVGGSVEVKWGTVLYTRRRTFVILVISVQ